jgi:disulfide bond formation protein DsbB
MKTILSFRPLLCLGGLFSFLFFLATYLLEYGFGLEPCPLCYLQRGMLFIISLVFCLGVLQNCKQHGRLVYGAILFVCSMLGGALASRQLWLQYISPVHESNCFAGFEKMLELMPLWEVLKETLQGSQECGQIDFALLGLPLSAWSLFSFIGLGTYVVILSWLQIKRRI